MDWQSLDKRIKKPLPILRPNPRNKNTYAAEDYPKPLGDHCVSCGWSPCKCEKHTHSEGEE